MERLISFFGLFVMMGLAWLMSSHRWRIPARLILLGCALQFLLAWLILRTRGGEVTFDAIGAVFTTLLDFVDAGSEFVFGERFMEFPFAFKVLPTIIFFSSLMSVLYYLGLMQVVVWAMAWVMQKTLGTSGAETLSACANVFVGHTEAPLVIKPFVPSMTYSELNAVMVGGFSTISGGLLGVYAGMDIEVQHLLAASVISAPAGLVIAKIMVPETQHSQTMGHVELKVERQGTNVIEAAAIGATDGLKLALNVAAMLLAFLAMIELVNFLIGALGMAFGYVGPENRWTLAGLLGWCFSPLAWLMGIQWSECREAGHLLGLKVVVNEFVAYAELGEMVQPDSGVHLSRRTVTILTYALCGFSNFGAIGIQIGGIGGIAPGRRSDLARLGLRAMFGGMLACCMTACVAGVLL